MNEITVFNFKGNPVRIANAGGEAGFVAQDVCEALGLSNTAEALARLDADEKGISTTDTPGGTQGVLTVNESGLYHLIFKSRKPVAVEFRRWITTEVLPSLRKFGFYGSPEKMAEFLDQKVGEMVQRQMYAHLRIMEAKIADLDLWPLGDYAKSRNVTMAPKQARLVGAALGVICRKNHLRIGKAPSPARFTTALRTFPRSVLDAHFPRLFEQYRDKKSSQLALVASVV